MFKIYLLVGVLCVPSIECFQFSDPKYYTKLEKCLEAGKKIGDEMRDKMNNRKIPAQIKVWCKETNQHGEYS